MTRTRATRKKRVIKKRWGITELPENSDLPSDNIVPAEHGQSCQLNFIGVEILDSIHYREYEVTLRNLIKEKELKFGIYHHETLKALNLLALLLCRMLNHSEAFVIYKNVLAACDHLNTTTLNCNFYDECKITALNNLGCIMVKRSQIKEAVEHFDEALAIKIIRFADMKIHCDNIAHNQANMEFMKHNYDAAATLYKDVVPHRQFVSESRNFHLCDTRRSLADSLYLAGKFCAAEALYRYLLKDLSLIAGGRHTSLLYCEKRLASTLLQQGKSEEAAIVARSMLLTFSSLEDADRATDAFNNPCDEGVDIFVIVKKIADLLFKRKEYAAAENLYFKVLPHDLYTVSDSIARCRVEQGNPMGACKFYGSSLKLREERYGARHPITLFAVFFLGDLHAKSSNYDDALACYLRAFEVYEQELGLNNYLTLLTLDNAGKMYDKLDRLNDAERTFSRALTGFEIVLGFDHVHTIKTVQWLGNVYKKQNKLAEAELFYIRALKSSELMNGMTHIETVRLVNSTAILLKRQGRLVDAEIMYKRALDGYEEIGGTDSRDALATRNNLGILCKARNDTKRAREFYDAALHGRQKLLGEDHTDTLCTMNNIGVLLSDQGNLEEAEAIFEKVFMGFTKSCGEIHVETIRAKNNLLLLRKRKTTAAR